MGLSFLTRTHSEANGPTDEERRVMENIDQLASFIRNTMMQCDKIRNTLKLGPVHITSDQCKVLADAMDLYIARPIVDRTRYGRGPSSLSSIPKGMGTPRSLRRWGPIPIVHEADTVTRS